MTNIKSKSINKIVTLIAMFWILLTTGIVTAENNTSITGSLVAGVESGCVILNGDDGKVYQLFNLSNETPPFGSRVIVNGTIESGIFSFCMQGISIKVSDIRILNRMKGDVNDDGVITSADALLYLRYAVGQDISPYHINNSDDVTCDNKISIADAIDVLRNFKDVPACR